MDPRQADPVTGLLPRVHGALSRGFTHGARPGRVWINAPCDDPRADPCTLYHSNPPLKHRNLIPCMSRVNQLRVYYLGVKFLYHSKVSNNQCLIWSTRVPEPQQSRYNKHPQTIKIIARIHGNLLYILYSTIQQFDMRYQFLWIWHFVWWTKRYTNCLLFTRAILGLGNSMYLCNQICLDIILEVPRWVWQNIWHYENGTYVF